MEVEFNADVQSDGQTDGPDEANSHYSQLLLYERA
jgi:hypothetical protein